MGAVDEEQSADEAVDAVGKSQHRNLEPSKRVFFDQNQRELVYLPRRTPDGHIIPAGTSIHYHSLLAERGDALQRFREFVIFHRE